MCHVSPAPSLPLTLSHPVSLGTEPELSWAWMMYSVQCTVFSTVLYCMGGARRLSSSSPCTVHDFTYKRLKEAVWIFLSHHNIFYANYHLLFIFILWLLSNLLFDYSSTVPPVHTKPLSDFWQPAPISYFCICQVRERQAISSSHQIHKTKLLFGQCIKYIYNHFLTSGWFLVFPNDKCTNRESQLFAWIKHQFTFLLKEIRRLEKRFF